MTGQEAPHRGRSVAVIGAGVTGLVAARRLALNGHRVDVYERWPGLGGQVATLDLGGGALLERYYHHLFPTDEHIEALYSELALEPGIDWLPSSVGMFSGGIGHPFTTPLDLLRFPPLPFPSRVRMGLAVLWLQRRHQEVEPFERMTAKEWILRSMGRPAYEQVWGPLLRGKFGDRADEISMAWLWSKLTLRRRISGKEARQEVLGYPRGGWQPLLDRLASEITGNGGRVLIDHPVAGLDRREGSISIQPGAAESFRRGHDPREFEPDGDWRGYDEVVATVPSDVFSQMLGDSLRSELGVSYMARVEDAEYHAAICLLLELDRAFSRFYWTNIADSSMPFIGLIEQTNLIDAATYGGRRFLYVANYVDRSDPLYELGMEELIEHYTPGLRRVNLDFSADWIRNSWLFKEPAAQPIVTAGYRDRIPDLATPAPGLHLANTTQIYPEDRGTNYSVELGERVAGLVGGRC